MNLDMKTKVMSILEATGHADKRAAKLEIDDFLV